MTGMKIEIDLAHLGLSDYDEDGNPTRGLSLRDLIVEAAVEKLVPNDYQLQKDIREKIDRQFKTRIEEKVKAMVEEAFEAPLQRTNSWGESKGEPVTVKELIGEALEKWLTGPRERNRSYNSPAGNLQELVDDATKSLMSKEFKANIDKAKEDIVVTVNQAALKAAIDVLNKH
ncbi:hypothetical protein ANMWB30_24020 [Arthrobacter sp. MWB30]|nr:hypothetical protein ANMWB30_24020 [Arthrobacter sp. MWB30]